MYAVIRLNPLEILAQYPTIPGKLVWPSGDETHGVSIGDKNHGYIFVNKQKIEEPPTSFHYPSGNQHFHKGDTLREVTLYSEPAIETTRQLAKDRVTIWKEKQQNGGFEYEGNHYQTCSKSRKAILSDMMLCLAALADGEDHKVKWTTTNNSHVDMNARQFVQFAKAAANHFHDLHEKAQALKLEIDSKTNAADIQAVLDTIWA